MCCASRCGRSWERLRERLYAGRYLDAARIAAIYNQGMEDRVRRSKRNRAREQILKWFAEGYPVFVSGEIKPSKPMPRFPLPVPPCYDGVREFSVYVAREGRGRDLARRHLAR